MLYAAMGAGGFRVFDVANIDNKDFSERMVTAPVSPLGQRLYREDEIRHRRRHSHDAGRRSLCARRILQTKSRKSI